VVAWYLGTGIVVGGLAGLLRSDLARGLVTGVVFYILISLKMFWLSAPLLTVPTILAGFCVFSVAVFGGLAVAIRRLRLSPATFALFVVVYFHCCQVIAAAWNSNGGNLVAYLLSARTVIVVVAGVVVFAAILGAQIAAERMRTRPWMLRGQALLMVAMLGVAASQSECTAAGNRHEVAAAAGAPDIYVLSFDALRRDELDRYTATAPERFAARVKASVELDNVVAEGQSTYEILANNTFAGGDQTTCKDTVPQVLRERGYVTMMLLGRFGVRIHGSSCYDYYYSGGGAALAPRFVIPALVERIVSDEAALRGAAIASPMLLDRFEQEMALASAQPVFAYMHVLDLHGPYVAPGQEHDPVHIAEMRQYQRGCYATACDPTDPVNAHLIASARSSYEATLVQLDAYTARVEALARRRGRPFLLVITADHGELFGEHGGFAHGGGFVPELLNVPFVVFDSRGTPPAPHRCELLTSGEALRATVTGAPYPDHSTLTLHAPPLGAATIDKAAGSLHYVIEDAMRVHSGTWRNIHREPVGDITFPLSGCAK
jgi:hypothetical protein